MMKKLLSFILVLLMGFVQPLWAAFDTDGVGVRAPGMANSFVGVADDANALFYNPAGLSQVRDTSLSSEYTQGLKGSTDGSTLGTTYIGLAQPLKNKVFGTLGFGYLNFKAQSLYSERTLMLSYGWKLKKIPFGLDGLWYAGATLKQMHRQYEPDRYTENALNDAGTGTSTKDPLFAKNGYGKDAYGLDLGALYKFGPSNMFTAGAMLMNVNRPDISIGGDGEKAPLIGKVGASVNPRWGLLSLELRRAKRIAAGDDTEWAVGGERRFQLVNVGSLAIRGGYATGSRQYKAVTTGMSLAFDRVSVDYAFNFPVGNLADTQGMHQFGVSFKLNTVLTNNLDDSLSTIDLLPLFRNDTAITRTMVDRFASSKNLNDVTKSALLQILVKKYPMDDEMMKVHDSLRKLNGGDTKQLLPWAELKATLVQNLTGDDARVTEVALDSLAKGDTQFSLARLALLSETANRDNTVNAIRMIALSDLAAKAYRADNFDSSIDQLRQMMGLNNKDEAVVLAYKKLLLQRTTGKPDHESTIVTTPSATPTPAVQEKQIPEAPQTLVAPTPSNLDTTPTAKDIELTKLGIELGHYFTRKSDGASLEERLKTLEKIKTQYGDKDVDLTLVDTEIKDVKAQIKLFTPEKPVVVTPPVIVTPPVVVTTPAMPTPTPQPVVVPTPVKVIVPVAPKPATKPVPTKRIVKPLPPAESTYIDEAWLFYKLAVERGISDRERIEILEKILVRYKEEGAARVNKELERIRRRTE